LTSVLIVSHEPLEERMAGPSIRNWELARVLSTCNRVTLAAPGEPRRTSNAFEVRGYDADVLAQLVPRHDVVQTYGGLVERYPVLADARYLVVDLYDPYPLENLHLYEARYPEVGLRLNAKDREALTRLMQRGDLFLCASDRQRDFWTGWLAAAGRINPYTHRADPALTSLLRVVPFGLPVEPPHRGVPRFKGIEPGIAADDFLVLWGGGVWNWFDPLTLIRAAADLRVRLPKLRVVFPALSSPSPASPPMAMATEARRLATELGLTGSVVFFGDQWVPYSERGSMLLEADVGVSLHREGVETRYSFRTRVLDYLWGALPIITTEGDSLADMVRSEGLGAVVPYGGVEAVADALHWMATHRWRRLRCGRRCRAAATRFQWPSVARPLLAYCEAPHTAPDRGQPMPMLTWPHDDPGPRHALDPDAPTSGANGLQPPTVPRGGPRPTAFVQPRVGKPSVLDRIGNAYRDGGLHQVAYKGAGALRRLLPRQQRTGR